VGPRAGLDRCRISHPTGIRSPDRPVRSTVAIPTTLPGPLVGEKNLDNYQDARYVRENCQSISCFPIISVIT
jgi:hypothetical protein